MDDIIDDVLDLFVPCTFCGWIGWTHWPCGSCLKTTIIEGRTNQKVFDQTNQIVSTSNQKVSTKIKKVSAGNQIVSSDRQKNIEFFKDNYISSRTKVNTKKQKTVLILDTSEGLGDVTGAMTDSSVIDVSPGVASKSGLMINLDITLKVPLQIDDRCDVFLDFISGSGLRHSDIANVMSLTIWTSTSGGSGLFGQEETADGTNYSIAEWPFAFTDESVNTLDIKQLKIDNNGNVKGKISNNQLDIENKLCFTSKGSAASSLSRDVTSTYSTNKYNYVTTILPTRIKKFTIELKIVNPDQYLRRTGSNPTFNTFVSSQPGLVGTSAHDARVAFELVFIPV